MCCMTDDKYSSEICKILSKACYYNINDFYILKIFLFVIYDLNKLVLYIIILKILNFIG